MRHILTATILLVTLSIPVLAQAPASTPPGQMRQAPPLDPRFAAAQLAFEALPEAERKAIQQDLGFAAAFNGAALGTFGTLTFNGIQNFQLQNKLPFDGILTPSARQLLAAKATSARNALKFAACRKVSSSSGSPTRLAAAAGRPPMARRRWIQPRFPRAVRPCSSSMTR
jgi:peptidoglycan hydrolase-like protein with peptidoglycan-binding domain